jgi:hypothetical protein
LQGKLPPLKTYQEIKRVFHLLCNSLWENL